MIDTKELPKAQVVPGLAGYVRTPYTNPPRLVDVRGMNAGAKVVCPFTNKPFIVPAGVSEPKMVARVTPPATPTSASTPTPAPEKPKPSVANTTPVPTEPTKVAAMNKPQPQAPATPAPAPQVKPQPQPSPPPSAPTKPAPIATTPPAKAETQEIPFGSPIAGRPGFVNSPYAAKHQLVDVTGLPVGMEVKCPYTGKLFRVPPQADAQGKASPQNLTSPEKK